MAFGMLTSSTTSTNAFDVHPEITLVTINSYVPISPIVGVVVFSLLIIFPLLVSYRAQKNRKNKN